MYKQLLLLSLLSPAVHAHEWGQDWSVRLMDNNDEVMYCFVAAAQNRVELFQDTCDVEAIAIEYNDILRDYQRAWDQHPELSEPQFRHEHFPSETRLDAVNNNMAIVPHIHLGVINLFVINGMVQ